MKKISILSPYYEGGGKGWLNNGMKKIFLITFLFSMLFIPVSFANSATSSDFGFTNLKTAVGDTSYAGKENLGNTIGNMINGVLALAGTIFLVLTVYGGITWMTAMGNQEKIEKARNIITAAIIGGAITGGAYAITFFVMGRIGGAPNKPTAQGTCMAICSEQVSGCDPACVSSEVCCKS